MARSPKTACDGLKDKRVRAAVAARIARVKAGLLGDCKPVGDDVYELRIHLGPGYRVYFALIAGRLVLLLAGGDKRRQDADILTAKRYLADYRNRQGTLP